MENIVLASNIRGAREVIDEGVDGFLFNPYKKDELYKLMLKVYNINDKNRKKIGSFARKKVIKNYNIDKYLFLQTNSILNLLK